MRPKVGQMGDGGPHARRLVDLGAALAICGYTQVLRAKDASLQSGNGAAGGSDGGSSSAGTSSASSGGYSSGGGGSGDSGRTAVPR